MNTIKILIIALLLSYAASANASLVVKIKPVRPKLVVVKPAKPGKNYVWISGHWVKKNKKYVWSQGRWVKTRPGKVWVAGHWKSLKGGWVWIPGHWYKIRR
jgi:hypothetical protein